MDHAHHHPAVAAVADAADAMSAPHRCQMSMCAPRPAAAAAPR